MATAWAVDAGSAGRTRPDMVGDPADPVRAGGDDRSHALECATHVDAVAVCT